MGYQQTKGVFGCAFSGFGISEKSKAQPKGVGFQKSHSQKQLLASSFLKAAFSQPIAHSSFFHGLQPTAAFFTATAKPTTPKVRTTSPVSTMSDLQWKKLVKMWSTARHKERCLKNKESREKVRLQQTTGSRCYVAQLFVARQTKYKDSPPTTIDHFKDTHCSSKKGFSENAKNAVDEMEAIVAEPQDGENPKTPVEAVVQVMPKSTFLQNVGLGSAWGVLY